MWKWGRVQEGKRVFCLGTLFSSEFTSERVLEAVLKQLKSSLEVYNCGDEGTARFQRTVEKLITFLVPKNGASFFVTRCYRIIGTASFADREGHLRKASKAQHFFRHLFAEGAREITQSTASRHGRSA